MDYDEMTRAAAMNQPQYEPGKPIEMVAREFGLDPSGVIKLASNENPLGPSPRAVAAARDAAGEIHRYPENSGWLLRVDLAENLAVKRDELVLGAGSSELFYRLGDLFVDSGVEVVMGASAFISYKLVTLLYGGKAVEVPLSGLRHDLERMREAVNERTRIVFLPNPSNPTGTWNPFEDVLAFVKSLPDHVLFVYDCAYAEYAEEEEDWHALRRCGKKVLVTRSFSKIYGLAGLRVGYGIGDEDLIRRINRVRAPFNVGSVGMAAARAALQDDAWVARSRRVNAEGLRQLQAAFDEMGLEHVPTRANFVLVRVGDSGRYFEELQRRGIIVRPVNGYQLPEYLRISIGTAEENGRLCEAMSALVRG